MADQIDELLGLPVELLCCAQNTVRVLLVFLNDRTDVVNLIFDRSGRC